MFLGPTSYMLTFFGFPLLTGGILEGFVISTIKALVKTTTKTRCAVT